MKKLFIVLSFCVLGLSFSPSAEAAQVSVSIGGMPGMMLVDNCGYYSGFGMPYCGISFYFSTSNRYYGPAHHPRSHHHHGHGYHGGVHKPSHHGPHGGHR